MNSCIMWGGCTDEDGYAQISKNGKTIRLNRIILKKKIGMELPKNSIVSAICGNKNCINPEHLVYRYKNEKIEKIKEIEFSPIYLNKREVFLTKYLLDLETPKSIIAKTFLFSIEVIDFIQDYEIWEYMYLKKTEQIEAFTYLDDFKIITDDKCFNLDYNYPNVFKDNKTIRATRYLFNDKNINNKDVIMHICDNPKCVRKSHLKMGTQKENMIDKVKKNRQTRDKKLDEFIELIICLKDNCQYSFREIAEYFSTEILMRNVDHKTIKKRYDEYKFKIGENPYIKKESQKSILKKYVDKIVELRNNKGYKYSEIKKIIEEDLGNQIQISKYVISDIYLEEMKRRGLTKPKNVTDILNEHIKEIVELKHNKFSNEKIAIEMQKLLKLDKKIHRSIISRLLKRYEKEQVIL